MDNVYRRTKYKLTVSGVRIDSLKETKGDPDVNRKDGQVLGVQQRPENRSCTENHYFEQMRVLRSKAECGRAFMMQLVDVFEKEWGAEKLVGYRSALPNENETGL